MKKYKVKIQPDAIDDIQENADWYIEQKDGLGYEFKKHSIIEARSLGKAPYIYAIRYNEIRCMPLKRFPYMIHYYINEETRTIEVLAVISTDRSPNVWKEKTTR